MDKRRSPRYPINLNALIHPNEGRSWLCSIQDFCGGGMLLVEQGSSRSRKANAGIETGSTVGIHFSIPVGNKERHFRLEGTIVRVLESGIGINFPTGMDESALDDLKTYSNTSSAPVTSKVEPRKNRGDRFDTDLSPAPTGRRKRGGVAATSARTSDTRITSSANGQGSNAKGESESESLKEAELDLSSESGAVSADGIRPADAKKIVAIIRRAAAKIIPEMNSAFFAYMDKELLLLARDAKTNAAQGDYFAAMSSLEAAKKAVGQAFANEVLDQIDKPREVEQLLEERREIESERKAKQEQRKNKLSLVNTEEFEDWLAVANIISRSERTYEKYLKEIHVRLGMLVESWAHAEANPLGAPVFAHAFDNAIREVELEKEIRQKVFAGFESKVIPLFRKLYLSITKYLEDSNLFPDMDDITPSASPRKEDKPEAAAKVPEKAPGPKAPFEVVEEEAVDDIVESIEIEQEVIQPGARNPHLNETRELRQEVAGLKEELRNRDQSPRQSPRQESPQDSPRNRRLSDQGSSQVQDIGDALSNLYSTVQGLDLKDDDQSVEYAEFDEVRSLLSEIDVAVSGQRPKVTQQLAKQAGRPIAPEILESLGVVENLVDSIETDKMVSGTAKNWVRDLELTLGKVAADNANFFSEDNPHDSLEVLNQLASLGGAESGSVRKNVDKIIQDIKQNYDSDPEIFDKAAEQLQPLVDRQAKSFAGNVQRTVKASEGQQTLSNAQRAVVSEIDTRLKGREVPEVLMKLLMPGWRNLLVNTHLRQGEDSSDWQRHIEAFEQIAGHVDGTASPQTTPGYMEPTKLLEYIEQGLDSISFEPGQRIPLINSLRSILVDGEMPESADMVSVAEGSVAGALGFTDVGKKQSRRETILEEWQSKPDWDRWVEKASNLHVGDWLEFDSDGEVSILAWSNDEGSSYVFVNRRGVKTQDLIIEELAALMAKDEARLMEESDLPLTDRASHRMLQNMHNQLTHQASHDELTGLANRKEFEKALETAIIRTKKQEQSHVAAVLDLDQFKVINNAAGLDAGDELLKNISKLLQESLVGCEHALCRLGGNEFGILIYDCARESGISVIRQLSDAIKGYYFEWSGDAFTVTASVGVVVMDADVAEASVVMRTASSACDTAKEAGRDRMHVFDPGDSSTEKRQDLMAFVSQIDSALKEDRLVLNCQKIQPVIEGGGDHAHYEILLTVLDENDQPMPPQDFIVAAETYNRMGAIDRWVIKNSFKWIASNILKLDDLGAFSINISGNSLTEDDFMEFVLEQFNETRLPTSKICFEITETSAIGSLDDAIEFMEKMKVIGVEFSLDDFGTGLSSYSYLRNLPVDYLKIDGVFVKDIKTNPNDYAVVKSINEIGHFMGKKTIAEYVEDDEILEILREIGVDFAQGYGIEKKMPITELLS